MSDAFAIREHCISKYVKPARRKGLKQVTIRVGDVAKDLEHNSGAVAQALIAKRFEKVAKMERQPGPGPIRSINTVLTFKLL
jgi:hypothetical protein